MPVLRIIYDVDGWAFHRQAVALQKYAPADFEVSLAALSYPKDASRALGETPVDLVFLLAARKAKAVRAVLQQRAWHSKLVVGWAQGVSPAIATLHDLYPQADAWIINNQGCWDAIGRLPGSYMIPNGVDLAAFTLQRPPESRAPKVLWTGSLLYRRLKGYDDLMLPLQKKLRELGIDCELLLVDSYGPDKRSIGEMIEWYNTGTVVVCASEAEGTPNPALEAAACGCTVVSTRVGNMPELIRDDVNGYLVDRTLEALLDRTQAACRNYIRLSTAMLSDIQAWHWEQRSPEFFRVFRDVLDDRQPRREAPRQNLSKAVTVFVTTVGAPTFETCLERLRQQDCSFTLEIIDHVAPMDRAFQRMMDTCRTPYYVQVDEDMLLYPHAVRTLYETIARADPHMAMYAADLYDAHLARCILGVKIFRHDIVRRYPFEAMDSFESVQTARMARDGFPYFTSAPGQTPVAGQTLGLHGVRWTPQLIYERYATLERRRRIYPSQLHWFPPYHARFLQRFLDDPCEENFFALQGVLAGVLASRGGEAAAKDYRRYGALPGFAPLRRFLQELEAPPQSEADHDNNAPEISRSNGSRRNKGARRILTSKRNGTWRGDPRTPGQ